MLKISSFFKICKTGVTYDYSSVQIDLDKSISQEIVSWGKNNIDNDDVFNESDGSKGRENEIHITVKYGLHTKNLQEIKDAIDGFGKFSITLDKVSKFSKSDKEYDVIKIDIISEKLHKLHSLLNKLENSDEHKIYKPHLTISYVKKGKCNNLSGNTNFCGKTIQVKTLTFSSSDGSKHEIVL